MYFEATSWTKRESWCIECRRFVEDRVERLREESVLEKLWEADGRIREFVEVGKDDVVAINEEGLERWNGERYLQQISMS